MNYRSRRRWTNALSILAGIFGMLTLYSGGSVLLDLGTARADAGNYVPFVLWFNVLAGFAYLVGGAVIGAGKAWAWILALAIAGATVLVFAAFGLHVLSGGAYETRTVGAMVLRGGFWLFVAGLLYRWRGDWSGVSGQSGAA